MLPTRMQQRLASTAVCAMANACAQFLALHAEPSGSEAPGRMWELPRQAGHRVRQLEEHCAGGVARRASSQEIQGRRIERGAMPHPTRETRRSMMLHATSPQCCMQQMAAHARHCRSTARNDAASVACNYVAAASHASWQGMRVDGGMQVVGRGWDADAASDLDRSRLLRHAASIC